MKQINYLAAVRHIPMLEIVPEWLSKGVIADFVGIDPVSDTARTIFWSSCCQVKMWLEQNGIQNIGLKFDTTTTVDEFLNECRQHARKE